MSTVVTWVIFQQKLITDAAGTINGNWIYKKRHFDVQILNPLIFFVMAACGVKFVINVLSIISVNIW